MQPEHILKGPGLYRFGLDWEPAAKLAGESAAAEAGGYPLGVSTVDRTDRVDAVSASRTRLERHFVVIQTGRNRHHHTVVLPRSIDDDVAAVFDHIFGRTSVIVDHTAKADAMLRRAQDESLAPAEARAAGAALADEVLRVGASVLSVPLAELTTEAYEGFDARISQVQAKAGLKPVR